MTDKRIFKVSQCGLVSAMLKEMGKQLEGVELEDPFNEIFAPIMNALVDGANLAKLQIDNQRFEIKN
ncbi:hypothetical protein [Photobacterium leiognathi]|uniref:hypothetical protein n=1 Tax=Photobacterium leiognathi TaxID=553611 RepID=UPI002980EE23|nr:hypothetical protein [Photobacterium leiognathi]